MSNFPPGHEDHALIGYIMRTVVAVSGAAVLVLGGATVASASVAPPAGHAPAGRTVQQARNGTSGTPDYVVPANGDPSSEPAGTTTQNVPAPASSASASVINLEFLDTCISCTTAHAGAHSSHGRSVALRLLGHDVAVGQSVSNASNEGALLALPINPLLNLAIADWRTTSGADAVKSTSFAHSRAALVDLALLGDTPADSLLTVALLESTSNATYTGALSHGDAVDNGVDLTALRGALVVIVLHSETSSDHPGSSYILSINGNKLGTSDQVGNGDGIPVSIPGVLTLTLLRVNAVGGSAVIGTLTMPSTSGETAGLVTAQSLGGAGGVPIVATPATSGVAAASAAAPSAAGGASRVPSTGVNLGIGGLLLVVTGAAVTVLALRRRRVTD